MTEILNDLRRFPAEWETTGAILLAWPHAGTDWHYMLDRVQRCYMDMITAFVRYAHVIVVAPDVTEPQRLLNRIAGSDRILYFECPTNDTWTRDYGPITVETSEGRPLAIDFCFNGWGLKFAADRDNLVTGAMRRESMLTGAFENCLGFVLEGGSIESDGRGTLLTTSRCLLSPNRNGDMSRDEIEAYLSERLGVRRVLWLDHGALAGDDTDSHIDTLARMAPDDTIFYVRCDDPEDEHYDGLCEMERQLQSFRTGDGMPYHLVGLPMPDAIYDEDGQRLPATYANYLVTPDAVFVPVYDQPRKDRLACDMLRIVFHGHDIVPIDCRALICQHGSLHCATMQIPSQLLPL